MSDLVPPPAELAQSAWECCFALREEWWGALSLDDQVSIALASRSAPDRLDWHEIGSIFRIFRETVDRRV